MPSQVITRPPACFKTLISKPFANGIHATAFQMHLTSTIFQRFPAFFQRRVNEIKKYSVSQGSAWSRQAFFDLLRTLKFFTLVK